MSFKFWLKKTLLVWGFWIGHKIRNFYKIHFYNFRVRKKQQQVSFDKILRTFVKKSSINMSRQIKLYYDDGRSPF